KNKLMALMEFWVIVIIISVLSGCDFNKNSRIPVIFDTDANNEVDDQHALAYLLFNGDHFNVVGVTVNATSAPTGYSDESDVSDHYEEAKRVMQMCGGFF